MGFAIKLGDNRFHIYEICGIAIICIPPCIMLNERNINTIIVEFQSFVI